MVTSVYDVSSCRSMVRNVRRIGAPGLDELPHPLGPVRPEPIEHHHLPLTKRGCEEVLHVGLEGSRVRGSL